MQSDDAPSLGPCCMCECTGSEVRNLLLLEFRCAVPGHGWCCLVCDLPADGASVVLCDGCAEAYRAGTAAPKFACRGFPGSDGRMAIEALTEPFAHDADKHAADEWC